MYRTGDELGPLKPESTNLTGYGFAALADGQPAQNQRGTAHRRWTASSACPSHGGAPEPEGADSRSRNAVYEVHSVHRNASGELVIDVGDTTLIAGFIDPEHPSRGYRYDVARGRRFSIPLCRTMFGEQD